MTARSIKAIRYVLIATATLLIGMVLNLSMQRRGGANGAVLYELALVAGMYFTLHLISSSVVALMAKLISNSLRPVLYVLLSIGFLAASIFLFSPRDYGGGIHLVVIFCASLVLIALDYAWMMKRQVDHERASPLVN